MTGTASSTRPKLHRNGIATIVLRRRPCRTQSPPNISPSVAAPSIASRFDARRLQQHFNTHVFKAETAAYTAEGIDFSEVVFLDNQDVLDTIEKRVEGRPGACCGRLQRSVLAGAAAERLAAVSPLHAFTRFDPCV